MTQMNSKDLWQLKETVDRILISRLILDSYRDFTDCMVEQVDLASEDLDYAIEDYLGTFPRWEWRYLLLKELDQGQGFILQSLRQAIKRDIRFQRETPGSEWAE